MLVPCSQAQKPEHSDAASTTTPPPLDGRAWTTHCPPRWGWSSPAMPGHAEPPSLAALRRARGSEGRREPWSRTPSPARLAALALLLQALGAAEDSQVCRIITTTCQVLLLRYFTPEICYIKGHRNYLCQVTEL